MIMFPRSTKVYSHYRDLLIVVCVVCCIWVEFLQKVEFFFLLMYKADRESEVNEDESSVR